MPDNRAAEFGLAGIFAAASKLLSTPSVPELLRVHGRCLPTPTPPSDLETAMRHLAGEAQPDRTVSPATQPMFEAMLMAAGRMRQTATQPIAAVAQAEDAIWTGQAARRPRREGAAFDGRSYALMLQALDGPVPEAALAEARQAGLPHHNLSEALARDAGLLKLFVDYPDAMVLKIESIALRCTLR